MKIKGCKLCNILEYSAFDNSGKIVDESAFSVHKNFILGSENFKNELASIEIVMEWPKEEL